jgi:hypothetical protein
VIISRMAEGPLHQTQTSLPSRWLPSDDPHVAHIHPAPQYAVLTSMRRTGAMGRFWHTNDGSMQDRECELRGFTLLRTWVNKPAHTP